MIKENDLLPAGSLTSKGELGIQHYDPQELFAKGTHPVRCPGGFYSDLFGETLARLCVTRKRAG